jgi:hypothetical protein
VVLATSQDAGARRAKESGHEDRLRADRSRDRAFFALAQRARAAFFAARQQIDRLS